MTRSSTVVKTTPSPSAALVCVITWVPAGTTTGCSSTAESQNVRSVRATDGGNGSMPTMLRKCT